MCIHILCTCCTSILSWPRERSLGESESRLTPNRRPALKKIALQQDLESSREEKEEEKEEKEKKNEINSFMGIGIHLFFAVACLLHFLHPAHVRHGVTSCVYSQQHASSA